MDEVETSGLYFYQALKIVTGTEALSKFNTWYFAPNLIDNGIGILILFELVGTVPGIENKVQKSSKI